MTIDPKDIERMFGSASGGTSYLGPQTLGGQHISGIGPVGGPISIGQSSGQSIVSWPSMTVEQQVKLRELQQQHEIDVKAAKIAEFKKIPANIRQMYVDKILLNKKIIAINTLQIDKTQELKDLERFTVQSQQFGFGATMDPPVISGVSESELIEAHNSMALEETLLEKQDEEVKVK